MHDECKLQIHLKKLIFLIQTQKANRLFNLKSLNNVQLDSINLVFKV